MQEVYFLKVVYHRVFGFVEFNYSFKRKLKYKKGFIIYNIDLILIALFIIISTFTISNNTQIYLKIKIVITIAYLFLILNPQYTDRPSDTTVSEINIEKNKNRPVLIRVKATVMEDNKGEKSLVFKTTNGKIAVASNGLPMKYMHYNQGSKFTIYYLEEKEKQIYKVYYTKDEALLDGYEYIRKPNIIHTQNPHKKDAFDKLWLIIKYLIFLFFVYDIYSIHKRLTTNQREATVYKIRTHPMKFNELFEFYTFKEEKEYYGNNFKISEKNGILTIFPNKSINIGFFLAGLAGLYFFLENGLLNGGTVIMVLFISILIITLGALYFIMQENEKYKIIFDKHKKMMFFYDEEKIYFRDIFSLYQTKVMIILPSDEHPYTLTYQLNIVTKEGKAYCIRLIKDSTQAIEEAREIASFIGKPLFLK